MPLTPEEAALRADAVPLAADLVARGEFELEIARRYPLTEAAEAHRQSETGHVRGKIVLIPVARPAPGACDRRDPASA